MRGESFAEVAHELPGRNDTQVDEVLDLPCAGRALQRTGVALPQRLCRCSKLPRCQTLREGQPYSHLPAPELRGGDRSTRDPG